MSETAPSVVRSKFELEALVIRDIVSQAKQKANTSKALTNVIDANREIVQQQRDVSMAWSDDPDFSRTRGAKISIFQLLKAFPLVAWNIRHGKVVVPDVLRFWIGDNFDFCFVTPLMRVQPAKTMMPVNGLRVFPDGNRAHLQLPGLFATSPSEGAISADCRELLSSAFCCSAKGDEKASSPWLANRITQTNKMLASLGIGHAPGSVFPLHGLLTCCANAKNPSRNTISLLLQNLDARLILRCILEAEGGRFLVNRWCVDLANRAREAICGWATGNSTQVQDGLAEYFAFFNDQNGLVVAAIEALQRKSLGDQDDLDDWRVYFQLDQIRSLFRLPSPPPTTGANPMLDKDGAVKTEEYLPQLGAHLLAHIKDFNAAADLFLDWESKEGIVLGDTAEDLLQDFVDELLKDGKFDETTENNVRRLRETLRERAG